jgi:hypothetical protein
VQQDVGGDALVFAAESEQNVLGTDVVVTEIQRFAQRQLQDLLGARGKRNLAAGGLLARPHDVNDLLTDPIDRDAEGVEDMGGGALVLSQQPEQDVLGTDVIVLQRPRLFLGENDDPPGALCEFLEQGLSIPPLGAGDNTATMRNDVRDRPLLARRPQRLELLRTWRRSGTSQRGTIAATRGLGLQRVAFTVIGLPLWDDGVDDDHPSEEDQ